MTIIDRHIHYRNGSYDVWLLANGTKIRRGEAFEAAFPESIDLKITDYCDLGCPFCHEQSTWRGSHGSVPRILLRLLGLPAGVEIAVGGGNPLDHRGLLPLLQELRHRGHIANMTVNSRHLAGNYRRRVEALIHAGLIKGLGISGPTKTGLESYEHAINHFIIGEQPVSDLDALRGRYRKILLLGYKDYGRGQLYGRRDADRIALNTFDMRLRLEKDLTAGFEVLSFDNLAIRQLRLSEMMKPEAFEQFYMGDDGAFTMYVDGVTDTYAKSSTSPRKTFAQGETARSVFRSWEAACA